MFCKNCGKEIDDNAAVCIHCGAATDKMQAQAPVAPQKNTMALVGFILCFFVPGIVSLIISIMGFNNSKKPEYAGDGRGLAIAGIVLSAIELAITVIVIIAVVAAGSCMLMY